MAPNLSALLASLPEANAALKANAPLPPAKKMTMADIGAALSGAETDVAKVSAFLTAQPGVITALNIVLASQGGATAPLRSFLSALPGLLAEGRRYLPDIATAITIFQPAPNPSPGMDWKAGDGSDLDAGMPDDP